MNKKDLSERDICSKFIGPAIKRAGWDGMLQIREEVAFTKGRIIVRGKLVSRGKAKRADYILYYKPNIPIAIVEAKDNNHSVGDGMQQALDYAATLNIPFVFSSNGDAFVFHDRTGQSTQKEANLTLDQFPSSAELWEKYRAWKGLTPDELELSNNLAENSMRPVALGRKNWIHIGSPQAGPKVAAILSVVESCRRLQVPVRDYFSTILPGLGNLTIRCVPDLTPAAWVARHS